MDGSGFTADDRKSLNILEIEMKHLHESMQALVIRMDKLEDAKVSAHDLEQTYVEVDELRQKKADKAAFDDHETRIRSMEKRIWTWMGAGLAVSVIASVLVKVLLG